MSFTVAEIQPTPNPNALKFILDRRSPTSRRASLTRRRPKTTRWQLNCSRSAEWLVCCLGDFVTVNKTPESDWAAVKRGVKKAWLRINCVPMQKMRET